MENIESKNLNAPEKLESRQTQSTASGGLSTESNEENVTLGPLSGNLARHLLELSKKVTANEVSPKTVHAACECASALHKIMTLNWKMKGK